MIYPKTLEGFSRLNKLDKEFRGTADYMGVAYFWNYDYRHALRDANATTRKLVHDRFLRAGLELSDASPAHEKIVAHTVPGWW